MLKLTNEEFGKICIAVDRFREHLGRDEAISEIDAIIALVQQRCFPNIHELERLRGDLFELRNVVTAENFEEMQREMEHWKKEAESYKPAWDAIKQENSDLKAEMLVRRYLPHLGK